MDIVKKNLLSVMCGVVALICIILLFFPLGGMYETLLADVKKSHATGVSLKQVSDEKRFWPSLSSRDEDKIPLTQFPNNAIIAKGKGMTQGWETTARQFLEEAIRRQTERLTVLVPGVLPRGGSQDATNRFVQQYQRKFGIFIDPYTGQKDHSGSLFKEVLKSTTPPTPEEVKAEQDRVAMVERQRRQIVNDGVVRNEPEVAAAVAEAQAGVTDYMRSQRARGHMIYADPMTSFTDIHPKMSSATVEVRQLTPDDIFVAQTKLWIQEELCRAIAETNQAADPKAGIIDTPVKRLLQLRVYDHFMPAPAVAGGEPPKVPSAANVKLTPQFTKNPLGHVSNEFYDVLGFEMTLIVDGASLPRTLTGLTRGRYAMFQQVDVKSVDSAIDTASGFLYGNKPVVQVTLKGQYLILREVTKNLMPDNLIRGLSIQPGAQPTNGDMQAPQF